MKLKTIALLALVLYALPADAGPQEDLFAACLAGNLGGVQQALDAGAKPNTPNADGEVAIAQAFFWPEITALLLSKGADPNLGKHKALFQAAVFYSTETMKVLLAAGADPNKPSLQEPSVLFKSLIAKERAKGAAANLQTIAAWEHAMKVLPPTEVYTLQTSIVGTTCAPCVEMLLEKGARVDKGVGEGNMLHAVANSFTMSKELWRKGFATMKENISAFGMRLPPWFSEELPADRIGSPERAVKLLVQKGVNINEKTKTTTGLGPMTPLELALNGGLGARCDVMLALVDNGADPRITHLAYGAAILQAAQTGCGDVVTAMARHGVSINTLGTAFTYGGKMNLSSTFTPLTAAAAKNRLDAVRTIMAAGGSSLAGVSGQIVVPVRNAMTGSEGGCIVDAKGKSAVFFAIDHDNLEMVRHIVENDGYDGRQYSYRATKALNCSGGGTYGPSGYAQAVGASSALVSYLQGKGL